MAEDRPEAGLRIGIDARAATEVVAGRGRVVRELLRSLAERSGEDRYVLFARRPWDDGGLDDRFSWVLVDAPDPLWHLRAARASDRRCDVFLATNSYLSAALSRRPAVLIVYDLMALDPATSPNRRSALIERLTLDAGVRRARRLLCISEATADALRARVPSAAPRVRVAHLAAGLPGAADPGPPPALPAPGFVLAVGTLEPRKNLPRLVEAYAALPEALRRDHPLVVVGASGWRTGSTVAALESLGERCIRLGHVSDATLAELYRRCALFCYPSLGEGFGLPVLEAMAAGAPVLTSNVSSLPEVGGAAAAYADPLDSGALAGQIAALLADPARRAEMSALGRARAAEFSWARFAAAVREACAEASRG